MFLYYYSILNISIFAEEALVQAKCSYFCSLLINNIQILTPILLLV